MTSINTQVQQIASVLRAQLVSLRTHAGGAQGGNQKVRSQSKAGTNDAPSPPIDLAEVLAKRVQQISGDDPRFKKKVFKVFLETVISAELGSSLVNDPRFDEMIDNIQQQMEADPQLGAMIDQAVASLTGAGR
jgi:hypothetical protein